MSDRFVVRLPLRVNARERMLLEQRLTLVGMLRNTVLEDLLRRGDAMRRDPRWVEARERPALYRQLRREYGLTEYGARQIARRHWQRSRWMGDLLDCRTAHALAIEILQNVDEWLFARGHQPRFKPAAERRSVWGESNQGGLVYDDGRIRWNTRLYRRKQTKLGRKSLSLKVDWSAVSRPRRDYYADKRIVRAGIQREIVRGKTRFFALLCYEDRPYRNQAYLDSCAKAVVGLDLGPSLVAAVGPEESVLLDLSPDADVERARARYLRRQQRALDRSRRATNPHCFDEQGQFKPGQKITTRSKRSQARRARIREQERKRSIHRDQRAIRVAREVARLGTTVATEKVSVTGWAACGLRLGKRIGLVAPSQVLGRVERECERLGGRYIELPTTRLALSQHCLCGARERKQLSQRKHECGSCGIGPLDRDLFAALLARLVGETGLIDLGDAPFSGTAGIQAHAERLCAPRQARGVTVRSSGGSKARSRANPQPDPGTRPSATRAGTSRKATASKRKKHVQDASSAWPGRCDESVCDGSDPRA